jgi:hypothetical protein
MTDTNTPAPSNGLTPELPVELPPAPAATSTKNVLGSRHLIKLADWCRENRPACEKETNPKLATIATAVLGFTVTGANIANALEALDIPKWKPEEEKPLEEQFIVIRGTMQNVLDTLALLSGRVTRLEEKEGKIDRIDTGDRVDAQALPAERPTDPGAGY